MKASLLAWGSVAITALILSAGLARAQISVVALTGQIAPGTGGARFSSLLAQSLANPDVARPWINNRGAIAFKAELSGGNVTLGIFKLSEGQLSPVILKGEPVPELGRATFGDLGPPVVNDSGDIVFSAFLVPEAGNPDPPPPRMGVFIASGATVRRLVDTETEAPGAPGQRFAAFSVVRLNSRGDVAFGADLDNKGSVRAGIFLLSDGALNEVVLSNQPLTAGTQQVFAYPHHLSLNNLGDVLFLGGTLGVAAEVGTALFLFSDGTILPIALAGQAVPNSSLVLEGLTKPWLNDRKEIVFVNGFVYRADRSPYFRVNAVVRWSAGALEKVFDGGAGNLQINNAGSVMLGTTVLDGGKSSVRVREGEFLEGIGKYYWIYSAQVNDHGTLVFGANMNNGSFGIYAQDPALNFKLFFPQVAAGTTGDHSWRTSLTLVNRSTSPATARLNFFGDDGAPLNVSIQGQSSNQFTFTIPALGTQRVQTEGTGPLQTGWARVETNQSLSGIASFAFFEADGRFLNEVGVPSTIDLRSLSLFAESGTQIYTGIALANPNDEMVDATLTLRDSQGAVLASHTLTLPPYGHVAKYVTELFADIPIEFQGRVEVVASMKPVVALTLRQRELDFTSLPVIP